MLIPVRLMCPDRLIEATEWCERTHRDVYDLDQAAASCRADMPLTAEQLTRKSQRHYRVVKRLESWLPQYVNDAWYSPDGFGGGAWIGREEAAV